MITRFVKLVSLFVMLSTACLAQSGSTVVSSSSAQQSLQSALGAFDQALSRGDAAAFEAWGRSTMLDNLSCVTIEGSLFNKQQMLTGYSDVMKSGGFHSEISERKITMFGDQTAVVTEVHNESGARFRAMGVWLKENGVWRLAGCAGASLPAASTSTAAKP